MTEVPARETRTGAAAYFALALGWSWLFWGVYAVAGGGAPARSPLFLIGGAGPLLAAVALTHLGEDAPVRRSFWLRAVDPRRIRGRWWAAALLLHPAIVALAVAADAALRGAPVDLAWESRSAASLVGLAFFLFWFGPLPEEIGWRGFALDRLQARLPAVPANLLLGVVWSLWHLPLFFLPDTYQAGMDLGSARSLTFLFAMVPLSVLMGWVYNHTSRSTLAAALMHYSGNLSGELVHKTDTAAGIEAVLLSLVALLVAVRSPRLGEGG